MKITVHYENFKWRNLQEFQNNFQTASYYLTDYLMETTNLFSYLNTHLKASKTKEVIYGFQDFLLPTAIRVLRWTIGLSMYRI